MFTFLTTNLTEPGPLSWDMAKQIIQTQSTLAMVAITVLVGVALLILAGSWIWHFRLHKRELEEAVESLKAKLTAEGKRDFMQLTKRVNDEVEKIKKEIEKSVEERIILFSAEEARLFAFANVQLKDWEGAVGWWADAIVGYAKAGQKSLLRVAVDALNDYLGQCKKLEDDDRKTIKKSLSSIPEILREEREQIEDKLKKLPKEITKQSETRSNSREKRRS
ncbi:hypothetical protein ES702_05571 [subsurface metagenome]